MACLTDERSFALIPADGKAVAAQMDQVCDSRFSGGTHADMDFVSFQSQNRLLSSNARGLDRRVSCASSITAISYSSEKSAISIVEA